MVYICTGDDSEKLDWFQTINIAGEPLTPQELRNAIYSGPWVSDAKLHFSKSNGAAVGLAGDYMAGEANCQAYLETAIRWHMQVTGDERMRLEAYEQQKGNCATCGKHFELADMHGDHVKPWSKGGRTVAENCQMLCTECNLKKGADQPDVWQPIDGGLGCAGTLWVIRTAVPGSVKTLEIVTLFW